MKKLCATLIPVVFFIFLSFHSFSQNSFKDYVKAAYYKSSAGQHQEAVDLLLKAKALKGIDTGYNGAVDMYLGSNYEALEKMKDCINSYIEAIRYYENKNDDFTALAFLYNRLGNIELYFLEQFQKAISYYRKQMYYNRLGSDTTSLLYCYNNIGLAYHKLKQYDSALFYFKIVSASNSLANQSKRKAFLSIGDTYSSLGEFSMALHYYDQCIPLMIAANDSVGTFMAYLNKGDCLMQQAQYKTSIVYLTKAQTFNNDSISERVLKDLYYNLADAYSHIKDLPTALKYKMLEGNINDSIITHSNNKAVADAEAKYETQNILDNYTISQEQLKLTSNVSADRLKILIATLISAAIIGLVAFLALRNASLRKKANAKLAAQKAKVEALATDLEEANQTKARLFSVISHDLRSPVSSLYASLKMQELNGGNGETSSAVSSQIMHLLDTLEDLLTWSKSQMDRFTLQPVTLRVAEMYADLIELHHDAAAGKQITIVNKAERLVKICTDENLLKTILRNVLANSIHHAPNKSTVVVDAAAYEGGVVCTISNEATATDAAMLEARLQTAAIGSSKHGLGNVLIKEFTQKLDAQFDVTYANGKVYLQIKVPAMQKPVNTLQAVG